MVRRVARPSTVDVVVTELRNAIYGGKLPPGSSLNEVRLAKQLGVSRGSLREATQRLVQEGALVYSAGRGTRVRTVETADIADLYSLREAIETQAVRMIGRGGRDLTSVDAALETLAALGAGDDPREIGDADLDFHYALVAAAGSRRLSQAMSGAMVETRLASLSLGTHYVVRCDLHPDHKAVVDALKRGNIPDAERAITRIMAESVARLTGRAKSPAVTVMGSAHESVSWDELDLDPLNALA